MLVEAAEARKRRALQTSSKVKSYLCSDEMVIRSDGSSTASKNTDIFNRGMKLSIDESVIQHVPLLRTRMHPGLLVDRFVLEEGVGDNEVVVVAEVSEALSVFIHLVDCMGADDAGTSLMLSSAHAGVEIAHDEYHVTRRDFVDSFLQVVIERVGGNGGCRLTGRWVDWRVDRDEGDVDWMSSQTAVYDSLAHGFPDRPSLSPRSRCLLIQADGDSVRGTGRVTARMT